MTTQKATRTLTSSTPKGQTVETTITRTIGVQDKISYSDGWNVNLGVELVDMVEIIVTVGGKVAMRTSNAPKLLDSRDKRGKGVPAQAVARMGDAYIGPKSYAEIMAALDEMEAELSIPEYTELKARQATARQAALGELKRREDEMAERAKNPGWCARCGDYTYGDCGH